MVDLFQERKEPRITEYYMSKEKRDARFNELKSQGRTVRRKSRTNQYMHPHYITDFEGPEKYDTGFGNTVYKTYFKQLYIVEEL